MRLKGKRVRIPYSPAAVSCQFRDEQHATGPPFAGKAVRLGTTKSEDLPSVRCLIHRFEEDGALWITTLTHIKPITLAVALVLTVPASAQTQRTDSVAEDRTLHSITVTDKARSKTISTTAPLHVLDSKNILRLGVTDIADALHRLPGITLRDYGGAGGMKTVAVRGFGAQHTGVSYDGIAMSDCQTGEIDVSRYSLENAENISLSIGDNEDIFIPARNASYAAMLSITTMAPPTDNRKPHVTAQVKVGSFGYVSPFIRFSQSLTDKFALTVSGEYTYAENDYPFTLHNVSLTTKEKRTNSMMNSANGEAGFIWNIGQNSRMDGKIYYYDNDRQLPGQVRLYTDISEERLHDRNAFAQMQYRTWNSRNLAFKLNAKFNWSSSEYTNGIYKDGVNDANYWQREAYASACLLYTPAKAWALSYSADYIFNNLNSSLKTDTRPYRHTVLQAATARYRNSRLTVMARLLYSLYFNAAKDGDGAKDGRRLSPSVSASYKLLRNEDLYIRISYKNIFRAPTFNESYFYHYGSKNLLPESTDQVNIGMTWRHGYGKESYLNLSFDGYMNRVKDKIVAVPYNMFVWTNINVGKVEGHGIETEATLSHRFNQRFALTATANYSWQCSENKTNKESPYYGYQIAYTPEHQGSAAISFENPWVNLSVHGHGMSHRYTNNQHYDGTRIDGYMEMGLTAYRTFKLTFGELEARADVKNLLDKQYEIVSHYPMPGRSYQISIKYKF